MDTFSTPSASSKLGLNALKKEERDAKEKKRCDFTQKVIFHLMHRLLSVWWNMVRSILLVSMKRDSRHQR